MPKDYYKLYQLMSFFVNKFSYRSIVIEGLNKKDELWMVNSKNPNYQIIRLTLSSLENVIYDTERIDRTISQISKLIRVSDSNFLDIHISNETVENDENYISICMDSNYYNGESVSYAFPGIQNVIHDVDDPLKEIQGIVKEINDNYQAQKKQRKFLKDNPYLCTMIIIALCVINYLVSLIITYTHSDVIAQIMLGCDYKMFTLGLGQFYRLITAGFCHGSIIHLIMNMMSTYYLGRYVEYNYGHVKFLILIFVCILSGNLCNGIMSSNNLSLGLSGGLYGLMFFYLYEAFSSGLYDMRSLYSIVFINLALNFVGNVAWQAHLGGLIAGLVLYNIYNNRSNQKQYAALLVVMLVALFFKYSSVKVISPIYSGTDFQVVEAYRDYGFDSYATKLAQKLYGAYMKYGGF